MPISAPNPRHTLPKGIGRRRTSALAAGATLLAGTAVMLAPTAADAVTSVTTTVSFSYTGSAQSWVAPGGVTQATFELDGAGGGEGGGQGTHAAPGKGGHLVATIPVVGRDTYTVMVGGQGAAGSDGGTAGWNGGGPGGSGGAGFGETADVSAGGGGGGATDIRHAGTALGDRVLVAGAGGGSSMANFSTSFLSKPTAAAGGNGSGDDHATAGGTASGNGGGGAGTSSAGGAGGTPNPTAPDFFTGHAGDLGVGGPGTSGGAAGGGGGGGGQYGGGGGSAANGSNNASGAGGGGSGFVEAAATSVTATSGVNAGNGSVTITYVTPIAPTITGTLPDGTVGEPYDFTFTTSGVPAPTCSVSAGSIPSWAQLDAATCRLSGTPDVTGHYSFTVTADNGTTPADDPVTLTVPGPPTLSGNPTVGLANQPYSYTFTMTGQPAASCSLTDGALPDGLTLASDTCTVSGTPTTGELSSFTLTATNGTDPDAALSTAIEIDEAPSVSNLIIPDATIGHPYSYQLPIVGYPTPTLTLSGDALPDGITMDPDGLIHGTPTAVDAKFGIDLLVANSLGSAQYGLHFFVDGDPSHLTSDTPPDINYGEPYSFTFTADGNPAALISIAAGRLPDGITLSGNNLDGQPATLTGTATELGDFPITVEAGNGFGGEDEKQYTLHVVGTAPAITNTPPAATVNTAYNFSFTTTGRPTPYIWTVESGTLPAGLQLFSNGVIFGFPTEITAGSEVKVKASNGVAPDAEVTFTLPVNGQPPKLTGSASGTIPMGDRYEYDYGLSGTPTPTVSVLSGSLPPGLSIVAPRYLVGTPTTPGSYTFTLNASNGITPDSTVTDTIVVTGSAPTISGAPGGGGVGEPYAFTFTTSGTPGPTVTRSAGTLPPGLTLSAGGTLSGTPTKAGTYRFTVRAANGILPAAQENVAVIIRALPSITTPDRAVLEGRSGLHPIVLPVRLSRTSTVPVTVQWFTVNGTAVAPSDYVAAVGTVTFAPGETTKNITVQVRGDTLREPTQVFYVHLHHSVNATIARVNAADIILNDD